MKHKYAYVTMLSTNYYLYGVLGLYQSLLDVKSKYPLLVCYTDNINQNTLQILKTIGIETLKINTLSYTDEYNRYLDNTPYPYWKNISSKFELYGLEQFEKIVCLDADLLILKNIDDLFDKPHGSAVPCPGDRQTDPFNAGVIVLEPSKKFQQQAFDFNQKYGGNEADSLFRCFPDWLEHTELHLPQYYNIYVSLFPFILIVEGIRTSGRIIHFIGQKKPFYCENGTWSAVPGVKHYEILFNQKVQKLLIKYNIALDESYKDSSI